MTALGIVEEKHPLTETNEGKEPKDDYVPFYVFNQEFLELYGAVNN
jgi:hypothetical protein